MVYQKDLDVENEGETIEDNSSDKFITGRNL